MVCIKDDQFLFKPKIMSAASKYSLHVKNGFVVLFFWDILPFMGAFAHLHLNLLLEMLGDLYKVFCFHSLNEAGQ